MSEPNFDAGAISQFERVAEIFIQYWARDCERDPSRVSMDMLRSTSGWGGELQARANAIMAEAFMDGLDIDLNVQDALHQLIWAQAWERVRDGRAQQVHAAADSAPPKMVETEGRRMESSASETAYYAINNDQVYIGTTCVAEMYIKLDGNRQLRILQGMPREETLNKLLADCPEFCAFNGITQSTYPRLFSPRPVEKLTSSKPDFAKRVNYAAQFCISRAGTGNGESTRALCNCVESEDGDQVLATLVRRAHKNPKLEEGIRLLFNLPYLNAAALRFGIKPLDKHAVAQSQRDSGPSGP